MANYGSVYFIKHKGLNPIKIGYSSEPNPILRVESFNTASPYGIEVLGYIVCKRAKKLESQLHDKYKSKRLNGEWFDISIKDVENELLIHGESDLHQQMDEFFRHKMKDLLSSNGVGNECIDLNGLNDKFVALFYKSLDENNSIIFNYKEEYHDAVVDKKNINARIFNLRLKAMAKNKGFNVSSITSNGKRLYKITKL
jgi:hypothetical protein